MSRKKPFRCNSCHRVMFIIDDPAYDHYRNHPDFHDVLYPDIDNLKEYK